MITVNIKINNGTIYTRSAVRIKDEDSAGYALYKNDSGELIKHRPCDGAVKLAAKLLKTIKEVV